MTKRDNHGLVFPGPLSPGLTTREYFAGQALIGIIASCANPGCRSIPNDDDAENFAKASVAFADALLQALAQGEQS
jgi:hypothetical protein